MNAQDLWMVHLFIYIEFELWYICWAESLYLFLLLDV